jgi:hypothetical protein
MRKIGNGDERGKTRTWLRWRNEARLPSPIWLLYGSSPPSTTTCFMCVWLMLIGGVWCPSNYFNDCEAKWLITVGK